MTSIGAQELAAGLDRKAADALHMCIHNIYIYIYICIYICYMYVYIRSHFGLSLRASESYELQIPFCPDILLRVCCVVQFCVAVFGVQRPTIENMQQ